MCDLYILCGICRVYYTVPDDKSLPLKLSVSLFSYGLHITDSPFTVNLLHKSPLTECWLREWPESDLTAGNVITAILDTTRVEDGLTTQQRLEKIQVNVEREEGKCNQAMQLVELEYERGVYRLQFTPLEPGNYCLYVRYCGQHIPESGLNLKVGSLFTHNFKSSYYQHESFTLNIELNRVQLYQSHSNRIKVGITQADGSCEQVSGKVVDKQYVVEYTPTKIGPLSVTLSYLRHTESLTDATVIEPPPPELCCRQITHNGTECVAVLDLHSPRRTLTGYESVPVIAVGVNGKEKCYPQITENGPDKFIITMTTTKPDLYQLSLFYYSDQIRCCPFPVNLSQLANPTHVLLYDPVIPWELGPPIELVLDTSRAGPTLSQDLTLDVLGSSGQKIPVRIKTRQEGKDLFRMTFALHDYGDYILHIFRCNYAIQDSPIKLPFSKKKRSLACIKYKNQLGPRVVITASLNINQEEGEIPAHSHNTDLLPKPTVQQYKPGRYMIQLSGQQQNVFDLHINCLNKEIKGSPFIIRTNQPPEGQKLHDIVHEVMVQQTKSRCHGYLSAKLYAAAKRDPCLEISNFEINDELKIAHIEMQKITETLSWKDSKLQLYWNHIPLCGGPFPMPPNFSLQELPEPRQPQEQQSLTTTSV